eukprot:TRINITY_DN13570_c0_g1_i1.p1 TRINITY_DN13570_c0_g1~~TRINITY_DN13570_c0_g1_i1.p1  ORF type:complete len:187 (+),score=52.61 TRINITY_DN13570_c0_g1_i1:481-1041(+)
MERGAALFHLATASPKILEKIFQEAYKNRSGLIAPILIESISSVLKITDKESEEVVLAIRELTKIAVYENSTNLDPLFPSGFPKDLQQSILQIIAANLSPWRQESLRSQPSLPHLNGFDWRIDVKRASEASVSMAVPTVLLELKVDDQEKKGEENTIHIELSRSTLETMLDGLTKIKSQLNSLNTK